MLPGITEPPMSFSPESFARAAEAVPAMRAAARTSLVLVTIFEISICRFFAPPFAALKYCGPTISQCTNF